MCTVGNLLISEASLSKLEKLQCSSALLNTKYNCAVLFWSQLYWVFIYNSKYIFSYTIILKCEQKLLILSFLGKKLLKFLQGGTASTPLLQCYLNNNLIEI